MSASLLPRQGDFKSLQESPLYAPARHDIGNHCHSPIWSAPIARLLAAGYSFLSNRYSDEGFLFRGMESGIMESVDSGYFGHFNGSREESRVERVMDICFLTHEIRDAVTVAGPGHNSDGGILVIPAEYFNRALASGNAAFLAIGDGGLVFLYPFLAEKIPIDEIAALIVTGTPAKKLKALHPAFAQKLVIFNPTTDRNNVEPLDQILLERGISPAGVLPAGVKPRREDLQTG